MRGGLGGADVSCLGSKKMKPPRLETRHKDVARGFTKTNFFTIRQQLAKIHQTFDPDEFKVTVHIGTGLLYELADQTEQEALKTSWKSGGDMLPFRVGGGPVFIPDKSLGTDYEIRLRGRDITSVTFREPGFL